VSPPVSEGGECGVVGGEASESEVEVEDECYGRYLLEIHIIRSLFT
jgi:hypothetical protein